MNRFKSILFVTVLLLIGATASVLAHARSNQKLGLPGVKTGPLANSKNLAVLLPDKLPGYECKPLPQSDTVVNTLPKDTSFGQQLFKGNDGFESLMNVVLMGSSRESIHKPQICLTAQGWNINDSLSHADRVHVDKPVPYDLPVMHLIATKTGELNGQRVTESGVYVYWFVDADRLTASHSSRMLWSAGDVLFKSELDRWAYVAFFAICAPGQEAATFERMKKLIAVSVPEFQLVPRVAK
jgi:hypothetical protein